MTREQIEELKRLEAEATPGPWWTDGNGPWKIHHGDACDRVVTCTPSPDVGTGTKNAALIAALRNAAPALLRAAERVRELEDFILKMDSLPAPCPICGVNGAGFYQPETHQCLTRRGLLLREGTP